MTDICHCGDLQTRRLSETNQRIHVPHSLTRKPGQQCRLSQAGCSSWISHTLNSLSLTLLFFMLFLLERDVREDEEGISPM